MAKQKHQIVELGDAFEGLRNRKRIWLVATFMIPPARPMRVSAREYDDRWEGSFVAGSAFAPEVLYWSKKLWREATAQESERFDNLLKIPELWVVATMDEAERLKGIIMSNAQAPDHVISKLAAMAEDQPMSGAQTSPAPQSDIRELGTAVSVAERTV